MTNLLPTPSIILPGQNKASHKIGGFQSAVLDILLDTQKGNHLYKKNLEFSTKIYNLFYFSLDPSRTLFAGYFRDLTAGNETELAVTSRPLRFCSCKHSKVS